jgi:hypothetical protein
MLNVEASERRFWRAVAAVRKTPNTASITFLIGPDLDS